MAWLTGWTYRKKVTVDSTKVGSGTHTDFPVAFSLDADITAEMLPLGQDIRVTASDGSTLLPHYLSQIGGIAARDGCWSWFSAPNAIYDAASNCVYYGGMNAHSTVSDEVSVWKHDFDTGEFSLNYLNPTHEEYGDDHNNPAFCLRSDGKLIVFTPSHSKSTTTQAYFINSTAGDISAFGSQKTISGWGASKSPAYSQAWRLSSESSGQKIWWFGRVSAAGGDSWYYTTSTDDGENFATASEFWVGTGQCYCVSISNGSNRMDFFLTDSHPDQGNQKVYHIYYDGNWRNSDASLINGGSIPAGGFDSSDLNASSTVMDLSSGSSTCWLSSTNYNASGNIVATLLVYVGDDTDFPEHHWASYSSGWSTEKIADASRLTSGATQPYYTGCSAVDPDEDAGAYIGVDVAGVIEIQRFVKSGTWSKVDDITTGSAADNFRPYVTYQHTGGQNNGKVLWCQGGFYNNYILALTSFKTGLRSYPPLGGFRATFKADSISSSANAEFYVYYGKSDASSTESPSTVYSGALAVPDLGSGDLTDNEVFADRFLGTDYVPQRYMEHGSRISSVVPVLQADSKLSPISTTRWLTGPALDMSGETGVTVEFFVNYDSSGANEHTVISNLKADASQGGMLVRIEPSSPADALEVFFDASTARISGTSAAGSIPANTDKFVSVVYNGNEAGNSKIYAQFDQAARSQLYTGASSSIKSPGSNVAMEMFRWADISSDTLLGAIGEMRVWGSAKSQGWSDTTYANFKAAGFYSLGAEETNSGTTITADLATTLSGVTTALTASHGVAGDLGSITAGATVAFAGDHGVVSDLATTLAGATAALTGSQVHTGDLASTLGGATAAFIGDYGVTSDVGSTLDDTVAAFTGAHGTEGTLAPTLEDVSAALAGSFGEDSDPNFANVSLLLHMDGADSSTTFTDSGSASVTVTANSDAQIDTAQFKFGGASGLFVNAGSASETTDCLVFTPTTDHIPASGDFTVEFWARPNSLPSVAGGLYQVSRSSGWAAISINHRSGGGVEFYVGRTNSATTPDIDQVGTLTIGAWTHVAVSVSGTSGFCFLGGSLVTTLSIPDRPGSSVGGFIGALSASAFGFDGWIDDLRVTQGIARYTAAFTPPIAAFPDSGVSAPSGDLATTLTGATAAFTGDHGVTATLTATTGATAAFVASHGVIGDFTSTLDEATAAFTGTFGGTTLQTTLDGATAALTASHGVAAGLGTVLTGATGVFAGTHVPAVSGDLAATLEGATAAFTGETSDAPAGDFSITLEDVGVSLQGSYGVTGDLTASVDGALAAFAGTHVQPVTGDLATTLVGATAAFTGEHPAQVTGDLQITLTGATAALLGVHGVIGDLATTLEGASALFSDKQPSIGFAPYPGVVSVTVHMGAISITPRTGYIPFTDRAGVTVFSG